MSRPMSDRSREPSTSREPGSSRQPSGEARRVGLVYETFDSYPRAEGDPHDWHVEYEPEATVAALEAALASRGHAVLRLGTPHDVLALAGRGALPALDAALCIAEGFGSRNREAWGPTVLEMAGVPLLGSDALTLSLTLDKAWTHRTLEARGVRVAPWCVMADPAAARAGELPADFPLFVKPRWEGTAKGIRPDSKACDRAGLEAAVARVVRDSGPPALVESFVPGAEYTVTVVGHAPRRALPVLQRALHAETGIGLHAIEGVHGEGAAVGSTDYELPGTLTPELERELQTIALGVCETLEVLDFARLDFRLDDGGRPVFLEINPLPTFAPDGTFAILAELEGRAYGELLGEVLQAALDRAVGAPWPGGRRPSLG